MARKTRIQQSQYPYHVTTRTNNGAFRFKPLRYQKQIIAIYTEVIMIASRLYHVQVHHLVLMDNHHHLYASTPEANLSRFMQYVNARVAERMNKLLGRRGHFWGERFHATILATEEQQLNVVRYMYRNPVRANLTKVAFDYERSTAFFYAFGRPTFVEVTKDKSYVSLGETDEERQARFVKEYLDVELTEEELETIRESLKSRIWGNEEVQKRIIELYDTKVKKKVPQNNEK